MISSYLKISIFIAFISISFQQLKEKVEFTVDSLDETSFKCSSGGYSYEFDIKGTYNGSPSIFDDFELGLETSDGRKIKSNCTPYKVLLLSKVTCRIDNCLYPLDKVDIVFPTTTPQIDRFTFLNWEKEIGGKKIPNVNCLTKDFDNIFKPSSIELGTCIFGENSFIIKGNWEKTEKSINNVYVNGINILLDNENKDVAKCYYYNNKTPLQFECSFKGYGKVKFKEQLFKGSLNAYKLEEFDSGKSAKKCSGDGIEEEIEKMINSGSFYYINKILILFALLLF